MQSSLWPDKGLLALEIKGGEIYYCSDTDSWTTRNHHGPFNIKIPLAQARHNMHSPIKAMEGELYSRLKGALTHGFDVVFLTPRYALLGGRFATFG